MGNNKELILVYRDMPMFETNKNINIMLTPQFYTIKKENLPVKYAYQAKRVAPSLFDGLLESDGEYEYFVTMDDEDGWLFIAYDEEKIKTFLSSKGIEASQVSKLFFAQQVVDKLDNPVRIGEHDVLSALDGVAVVVPTVALAEDTKIVDFDDKFTPKNGLSLRGVASKDALLTNIQTYMLAVIFVIFAIFFALEGLRYSSDSAAQNEEMTSLLSSYPSLSSSYTRGDTIKKYTAIDKNEHKKRKHIKALSKMIFMGSTLTQLHLLDTGFKAMFSCDKRQSVKKLEALAKKNNFKSHATGNSVEVTGVISR